MKKQTLHCVMLDTEDVTENYDRSHKFMAFLKGTWKAVRVEVFEHTFETLNMVKMNDISVFAERKDKKATYFTKEVAEFIKENFGDVLEARCMQ